MKLLNYWDQFLSTGTIDDYLSYRETCRRKEEAKEPEGERGAVNGEGSGQCYRDHIEGGTGGGV